MKKPTSTFWICVSILIAGLFIAAAIYQANRYAVTWNGLIIDKYKGTMESAK